MNSSNTSSDSTLQNVQEAPYPKHLRDLVSRCTYREHEGWHTTLRTTDRDHNSAGEVVGRGLTLIITTKGYDTYNTEAGTNYRVNHYFIVPAATYNRQAWQRWLFEQFAKVELHECMENFVIDGERPFAPTHGPGDDPYTVNQYATDEQRRTRFTGDLSPN